MLISTVHIGVRVLEESIGVLDPLELGYRGCKLPSVGAGTEPGPLQRQRTS